MIGEPKKPDTPHLRKLQLAAGESAEPAAAAAVIAAAPTASLAAPSAAAATDGPAEGLRAPHFAAVACVPPRVAPDSFFGASPAANDAHRDNACSKEGPFAAS